MPINAALIVALVGVMLAPVQKASRPDAEGFIRDWLVLAPIPIEGESGADQIDKDFINGEAAARPQEGGKATARGTAPRRFPSKGKRSPIKSIRISSTARPPRGRRRATRPPPAAAR